MDQTTQTTLDEFIAVVQDTAELAVSIAKIETSKAEAASEKKRHYLDSYIQTEQAMLLKLRGLEQKRTHLAEALGWKGLTFRQILANASPEDREKLLPSFNQLEESLKGLETSRKASEQILNVRLHELQVAIARREGGSYDDAGNVNLNSPYRSKMKDRYV